MKGAILLFITVFTVVVGFSQEKKLIQDQNPNYRKSMDKYLAMDNTHTLLQGTTSQETYKAIDFLEEKRELRRLKRKYRANRLLWRHQERLERIRNTQYYNYEYGGYPNNYYPNYYNNWANPTSIMSLGF